MDNYLPCDVSSTKKITKEVVNEIVGKTSNQSSSSFQGFRSTHLARTTDFTTVYILYLYCIWKSLIVYIYSFGKIRLQCNSKQLTVKKCYWEILNHLTRCTSHFQIHNCPTLKPVSIQMGNNSKIQWPTHSETTGTTHASNTISYSRGVQYYGLVEGSPT